MRKKVTRRRVAAMIAALAGATAPLEALAKPVKPKIKITDKKITLRREKGDYLSHAEMDDNFAALRDVIRHLEGDVD